MPSDPMRLAAERFCNLIAFAEALVVRSRSCSQPQLGLFVTVVRDSR